MNREEKLKKLSELKAKASELKIDIDYYNSLQLALKLVLNGSYGAFATPYFILYNNNVAGTITAEGRELTRTMDEDNQDYWYNIWHNDTITHERMYIKNVKQIDKKENVSIYGDSVSGDSKIHTDSGTHSIEFLYNRENKKSIRKDKEVIPVKFKSLNWTKDRDLHMSEVKNIIRHKVSKKKWKIKAGGKEVIVTEDHSIIIFRDGEKIEVKPKDIKSGDEVLIYN